MVLSGMMPKWTELYNSTYKLHVKVLSQAEQPSPALKGKAERHMGSPAGVAPPACMCSPATSAFAPNHPALGSETAGAAALPPGPELGTAAALGNRAGLEGSQEGGPADATWPLGVG